MRNRQASLGKIVSVSNTLLARLLILLVVVCFSHTLHAQTITWAGRPWKVTGGGMAGVARGNPENVSVDEKGYLHVRIEKRDGKWTASELFTAERFGFGERHRREPSLDSGREMAQLLVVLVGALCLIVAGSVGAVATWVTRAAPTGLTPSGSSAQILP